MDLTSLFNVFVGMLGRFFSSAANTDNLDIVRSQRFVPLVPSATLPGSEQNHARPRLFMKWIKMGATAISVPSNTTNYIITPPSSTRLRKCVVLNLISLFMRGETFFMFPLCPYIILTTFCLR